MKIAYFDCLSGISGDMCLGSIIDVGVSLLSIKKILNKLKIDDYKLKKSNVLRAGISATKIDVITSRRQDYRKFSDIKKIVSQSSIPDNIKEKGFTIFKKIFESEAKIHKKPLENTHLHELGAIDCIVDIFGTLIGLDILKVEKIYSSPINLGCGTVKTAHGNLPIPSPATLEILKGYPIYLSDMEFELTTPTGAAILTGLNAECSFIPLIKIQSIGYGGGDKDIRCRPNVLRIIIGEDVPFCLDLKSNEDVIVVETNIDDMNPQFYEIVMDKLFKAGALDVFFENIIMKKTRPAIKLTVITQRTNIQKITDILFNDTTTIGIRFYNVQRKILDRKTYKINTPKGTVRIKIASLGGKVLNITPELEDLKFISQKSGIPIKNIYQQIKFKTSKI